MRHHVSQSIRGALWNRRFEDFQHDDGQPMSALEAFNELCDELARGHEVVPVAGCDNFDPQKGCLGHPETLTETLDHLSERNAPAPQSLNSSTTQPEPLEVGRS